MKESEQKLHFMRRRRENFSPAAPKLTKNFLFLVNSIPKKSLADIIFADKGGSGGQSHADMMLTMGGGGGVQIANFLLT